MDINISELGKRRFEPNAYDLNTTATVTFTGITFELHAPKPLSQVRVFLPPDSDDDDD